MIRKPVLLKPCVQCTPANAIATHHVRVVIMDDYNKQQRPLTNFFVTGIGIEKLIHDLDENTNLFCGRGLLFTFALQFDILTIVIFNLPILIVSVGLCQI